MTARRILGRGVALLLVAAAPARGAEYANPQLLVSPATLERQLGRWAVLDCRDVKGRADKKTGEALKGYEDGHVPGAVNLGGDCSAVLREKETLTVFKDPKRYQEILGKAGLDPAKTVVVYSDAARITHAAVGFWILEYLGQKDVRFLDGGIEAWAAEGKKLETAAAALPPGRYRVRLARRRIATTDEVLAVASGREKGPQLVDARTAGEYAGTDVRARRGGHVPGCRLNVSHVELYDRSTGRMKSMDELEKLFPTLDRKRRVIPYCQTGTRSSLAYLAFRLMGFEDPANYDDSWIIWGNRDDLPVEK